MPGTTPTEGFESNRLNQSEFRDILRDRFGDNPYDWAFVCPRCSDVASGHDMNAALLANPRTRKDGSPVMTSDVLGQECIGRTLGALRSEDGKWHGRGCDWSAYGLFRGPLIVTTPDGREIAAFRPAGAAT